MVYIIFNKITAVSLGNKIDLKMVMTMLTHCRFVWADDVGVNVKIEFTFGA